MRAHPAFTRLLVVLLLLQWGTAFSQCLKLAAPQPLLHVSICTPDGLRSVALSLQDLGVEQGAADPDAPAPKHAAAMICPVCGTLGGAALPPPAITLRPSLRIALVALPEAPATPSQAPQPRRLPPTRAPPTA